MPLREIGRATTPDPSILAWTAQEDLPLLTHDVNTMVGFAFDRLRRGEPMPGLIVIRAELDLRAAIEALFEFLVLARPDEDLVNKVRWLPI